MEKLTSYQVRDESQLLQNDTFQSFGKRTLNPSRNQTNQLFFAAARIVLRIMGIFEVFITKFIQNGKLNSLVNQTFFLFMDIPFDCCTGICTSSSHAYVWIIWLMCIDNTISAWRNLKWFLGTTQYTFDKVIICCITSFSWQSKRKVCRGWCCGSRCIEGPLSSIWINITSVYIQVDANRCWATSCSLDDSMLKLLSQALRNVHTISARRMLIDTVFSTRCRRYSICWCSIFLQIFFCKVSRYWGHLEFFSYLTFELLAREGHLKFSISGAGKREERRW